MATAFILSVFPNQPSIPVSLLVPHLCGILAICSFPLRHVLVGLHLITNSGCYKVGKTSTGNVKCCSNAHELGQWPPRGPKLDILSATAPSHSCCSSASHKYGKPLVIYFYLSAREVSVELKTHKSSTRKNEITLPILLRSFQM
ncbi:hypothetical protein CEXT_609981 [Caerostris extrusa]|uniref:Uncharacterized protein n=1 Tax=Caerostris extrusa TaxID=172846 RepID=A0AAV4WBL5_CAEEX|nr:hypothetical protein CEXT_609981 [Caerostris extrusa]